MEQNHNVRVDRSCAQNFTDFPECATNGNSLWNHHDSASGATHQQQFYPPYDQASSFLPYSHHHSYQDDFGHYQPSYQTPIPSSYYQPSLAPYQAQYQCIPAPPSAFTRPIQPLSDHDNGRDYRIPTSSYIDISPMQRPYQESSPMQRMQQLTRKQYGGPLAAQSAAAAAADAARTARRISPPGRGKTAAGEETVRDVLHRQYLEQRRQEELKQQLHQQSSLQQGPPQSVPAIPAPPPSTQLYPSIPSPAPLLEAPGTPATPIFTFPTGLSSARSSPPSDGPLSSALGPHEADLESMKKESRLKAKSLMMSLHRANVQAAGANASAELLTAGALHQALSVVQALEAKGKTAPSPSRKRPLVPVDRTPAALKPGMRTETNALGDKEERLYVLVRHCNHNDPDYNPDGVLMPYDQYKKEENREDMITFSYSSVVTPYEYVDFRVKKSESIPEVCDTPKVAATSKVVS